MKNALIGLIVLGALILLFSAYKIYTGRTTTIAINSYEECVTAGYPILESYPEQCKTPDGKTFTNTNAVPVVQPINESPSTATPSDITNEQTQTELP